MAKKNVIAGVAAAVAIAGGAAVYNDSLKEPSKDTAFAICSNAGLWTQDNDDGNWRCSNEAGDVEYHPYGKLPMKNKRRLGR